MFGFGAKKENVTLSVKGMMCEHCKARVEKALKSVKGVCDFDVNVENAIATVSYDAKKTDITAIIKAVEEAGYETVEA